MEQQQPQLNYYLRVLWKGKWMILLTTLVALVGVVLFTWNQPPPTPSFLATATVVVEPVSAPAVLGSLPPSVSSLGPGLGVPTGNASLNTQVQLMASRNVMERALQKLQPNDQELTPGVTALELEAFQRSITIQPILNTNFIQIRARGSSPDLAERKANAVVDAYIDYIKAERTRAIQNALDEVSSQIQRPDQPKDVGAQALELLPEVGQELTSIAVLVEGGAAKLEELRTQEQTNESTQSVLNLEVPEVQRTAEDLDAIARDLLRIRSDLDGLNQQAASGSGSMLIVEASRVDRSTQDLEGVARELRNLGVNVRAGDPQKIFGEMAVQADSARGTLLEVPKALDQVRADSITTSQELVSIKDYVNSVGDDLSVVATQVRESASKGGFSEQARIRLAGQITAYTVGLNAARDDLKVIRDRGALKAQDYGHLVTAEGLVATSVQQLNTLVTQLNSSSSTNSVQEGVTQVLTWVGEGQQSLVAASQRLRELEASGPEGQQSGVVLFQISGELDNAALILNTASVRLQGLQPMATDPLVSAQLGAIRSRLDSVQTSISSSASRLAPASPGNTVTLADRVGVVQDRIQTSAEGLWSTLENIEVATHLPSSPLENEAAHLAYADTESIARSLEIASRQLQGLLAGNTDPLVEGELSTVGDQLIVAQDNVRAISTRLSAVVEDPRSGTPSALATNQLRLETAARMLRTASTVHVDLAQSSRPIDQDIINRTRQQIEIGTAIVGLVAQDIARLHAMESDALRYGQLVVLEQSLRSAETQARDITTQLQQLLGGKGPQYLQLRQLQQQLELSLLQPQDTGITIVDSAVLPQATGRSTIFSRLRIPLGAFAGFLLGSVGVLVKAQLDRTVRSTWQIREQLGLANLGVVPKGKTFKSEPPKLNAKGLSDFSEALQLVGTSLSAYISRGTRTFLVTSARAKEGKTTLSVNLAQVLSQYGRRVLLIDGNLRKPEVARILSVEEQTGLSEALTNQRNPMDYIVDAGGFAVLPGGTPPPNPVELLSSPAMTLFLQQAQQRYDVVVIDSPPAVGFAETKALAKGAGGTILVIKGNSTSIDSVNETKSEMEAAGAPLVGAVLNFAPDEECGHLRHEKYGVGS